MGMTDHFIIPKYAHLVGDYINENLKPGNKVAWLGQQQIGKYSDMFSCINLKIQVEGLEHHFYDILNEDEPPINNKWDVHDKWENAIKGYDLVLGLRLAYLVQSSSGLIRNLKYAVQNNKRVMFDFNTGNIVALGPDTLLQSWPAGSTNLIPHFKEAIPEGMDMQHSVSHSDNLFTTDMLNQAGLEFGDYSVLKDPIKGRIYVLAEIIEK